MTYREMAMTDNSNVKHKPATALPFTSMGKTVKYVDHGEWRTIARLNEQKFTVEAQMLNAAYLAHAANAYPRFVAALRNAIDKISSEYCSHDGPCGPHKSTCYVREYADLLIELGEELEAQ